MEVVEPAAAKNAIGRALPWQGVIPLPNVPSLIEGPIMTIRVLELTDFSAKVWIADGHDGAVTIEVSIVSAIRAGDEIARYWGPLALHGVVPVCVRRATLVVGSLIPFTITCYRPLPIIFPLDP